MLAVLVLSLLASPLQAWPLLVGAGDRSITVPVPLPTLQETVPLSPQQAMQGIYRENLWRDALAPSPHVFWHRLDIKAQFGGAPRRFYLTTDIHILRHLDFYVLRDGRVIQQQRSGLLDAEPAPHYEGVYLPLTLQPGDMLTVLIRKENTGPGILPLSLQDESAFKASQQKRFFVWGGVIAVLAVLALYNAMIYAMYPGSAYLWYLLFHATTFCYFSGLHGFGFWLWPDAMQRWLAQGIMGLNFILLWLIPQFANAFLDGARNTPWHRRHLYLFHLFCLPGAVLAFWLPEYKLVAVFSLMQVIGTIFFVTMGFAALRNGFRPALFFLLSWIFVGAGAGVGMATFMGILPANFFTVHGFLLGSMAELITLSVALADRVKFTERQTLAQAFVDPHTGAPNFSFFTHQFPAQLDDLLAKHSHLFLVVIELRGMRELVSLLGPEAFRLAYDRHSERMTRLLRQQNWSVPVQMLSGDEQFFMTLPGGQELLLVSTGHPATDSVVPMLQTLLAKADESVTVNGVHSKIGLRLGCAPFRPQQHDISECFRQAQVALMTAQRNRRLWDIFDPEQDAFIKHRLSLLSDLRQAIAANQLQIHIQPQFDMASGALAGGEVLVRWQHPEQGFVSPALFIPLAERSQLVFDITRQVLQKTCAFLQQQRLPDDFHLSVNLSALDIGDSRLLSLVRHCLQTYNISARRLLFEVTESALMHDPERFLDVIRALREMGFRIAIDDFGTGYSSMTYLQQMGANEIKVDIRFVRNIHLSKTSQDIVKAIVQLAVATHARAVAEGVENEQELATLLQLGCTVAQGFFWSPALPAADFAAQFFAHAVRGEQRN